ncbi:PhlD [Streptomyces sp. BH-SS-21]|uniref:PhlD n=1 Tax=Streptomyces liliiviolaceus TaxID=2823109 RepID=A0A940XUE8_9ACTN|nr:PhlD [Streptomyces liliiviolaceus]MBQ0850366.1 PhlD [Streptomyces liliiviolaceus]
MAFVNRPGTADAAHQITTAQIVDDIITRHPGHPRTAAITRIAGTVGVDTRRFTRPLADIARTEPFQRRNERAYADVCELAERAARRALTFAGVPVESIATLITSHATGLAIPGLDIHLVNALGLRQTITRIPLTQLACAGGAYMLGLAATLASPGRHVLVVGAEALSSVYQHTDTDLPAMIYKMLFGDGGAATVVSTEPLQQPGLVVEDSWNYVHKDGHQDSSDYYRLRADEHGYHFDSSKAAVSAVSQVVPLLPWHSGGWKPDFAVIHPGSSAILQRVADAGACSHAALDYSRACLHHHGNTGGTAVLRTLARVHDDPPSANTAGLLFGVGPGFCAAALQVSWQGST